MPTATVKPNAIGVTTALHFLANEDEAQHTGYRFTPVSAHMVRVERTYHHPEYADYDPPKLYAVSKARELFKSLTASGEYVSV